MRKIREWWCYWMLGHKWGWGPDGVLSTIQCRRCGLEIPVRSGRTVGL